MIQLDRTIPLTLLGEYLIKKGIDREGVNDCVSALGMIKGDDALLKEKACASLAFMHNKTSLWDAHGFSNICLIMNNTPASADYIAAVDPVFINYAVWEIGEHDKEITIGPESRRFISASLQTHDYPCPPEELYLALEEFKGLYPVYAEDIYKKYREASERYFKGETIEDIMDSFDTGDEDMNSFLGFHITKLLAADEYLEKMKTIYTDWKEKLREEQE